jgi:predicted HAD superfamily Cof-like phosphohydrolase
MKMTQAVLEFHQVMDCPVYSLPSLPETKRCELRKALMKEELAELCEAIDKGDLVKIADGLADLYYVVTGTAWEFGLAECMGDIFAEVHRSNMSKIDPQTGKPIFREDGKVIKPPTYSPANLTPIIQKAQAGFYRDYI